MDESFNSCYDCVSYELDLVIEFVKAFQLMSYDVDCDPDEHHIESLSDELRDE